MKKIYLFGNWKMNMSLASIKQFSEQIKEITDSESSLKSDTEVCVFPPFIFIPSTAEHLKGISRIGSQNISEYDNGAYTGEVSASMLKEFGVSYAIVGHSERRHIYGETSDQVNRKALQAIHNGIVPVICVGETLEEREQGLMIEIIRDQLETGVKNIPASADYLIAYEPVWAIGTGRAASPKDAEEVCSFIKTRVSVPVLYGGSVKSANAAEIFSQPSINGGLIGGASMDANEFMAILKNYRNANL